MSVARHKVRLELAAPGSGRRGWEPVCECGWIGHLHAADSNARAEGSQHAAHPEETVLWSSTWERGCTLHNGTPDTQCLCGFDS